MKSKILSLLFLVSSLCHAGLVSHTDYSDGNVVTASGQNTNENAIFNEFNGNIDNNNIKTGGITGTNIAAATIASSKLDSTIYLVPTGAVLPYINSTAPTGWLVCDGTAVSRTTYAALFALIGTAYGQGDNSTTFNVPDMRGKFARGWDNSAGNDPDRASRTACTTGGATGDAIGSCQAYANASHTHTASVTDPGHTHTVPGHDNDGSGDKRYASGLSFSAASGVQETSLSATTGITVGNSSTGGNEARPINVNFIYIIRT